jgi:hypothetical protein
MNDLDEIRIKDLEELSADDKKALNEGWDKLTKEEQDYFGKVHSSPDNEFKLPFKTQEELDKYLDEKVAEKLEARKKEREESRKKTQVKDESIFPEGYKAKDWNEAFSVALPKIQDRIIKSVQEMNQKQKDALNKINKEFDQQFKDIATKDKNVPKEGTKDREEWEADVADVGVKYKLHSMTDAYEVWKALATSKSSISTETAPIQQEGQPRIAPVSKVNRGYGQSTTGNKTVYKVGGGKRLDDLIAQRMREEGIPE